jgi:hypothetical protein
MNDLQAWSIEVSAEMCGKVSARFNGHDTSALESRRDTCWSFMPSD